MPSFPQWINTASIPTGSGIGARAVTPSDSADLPFAPARAIYVGTTGNVSVIYEPGSPAVVFPNCPVGFEIRGLITRVTATGTTASSLVAQY